MKKYKRVVIKIGSSSLTHGNTGDINYRKLESLVRVISDLKSQGKEVVLVSSGAQAVGKQVMHLDAYPSELSKKQALCAIGQAKLMMSYQRLFAEYHQNVAQVLLTKASVLTKKDRFNAENTFRELLKMNIIPIVNENDTVSTEEIEFGDNDHLSALVTYLIGADLLIILSDIDGMYTDDLHVNPHAQLIHRVDEISESHFLMGKETSSSSVGTGGMRAKVNAASIATQSGADMVLMNGNDVRNIYKILDGESVGTLFKSNPNNGFNIEEVI